ncbi:MAG: PilZ domain-containing protein [Planctomycetota bacterium]|jgi:c-di-GMP-binding flagellar brake protein YcgR
MNGTEERRQYKRFPVSCPVTVTRLTKSPDPSAKEVFEARLDDISQGGVRLESRELLQPNEQVRLIVAHQKNNLELNCTALVKWTRKVTGFYQSGVKFTAVEKLVAPDASKAASKPQNVTSQSSDPQKSSKEEPPASTDQS